MSLALHRNGIRSLHHVAFELGFMHVYADKWQQRWAATDLSGVLHPTLLIELLKHIGVRVTLGDEPRS